jgi:hypothetical protein
MQMMNRALRPAVIAAFALLLGSPALAQIMAPGAPPIPTPPPPPPPKIEVPVVPQLDAPPQSPKAKLQRRGSFSDRVVRCLDEGAAAGLGANDRAAYSRACANQ